MKRTILIIALAASSAIVRADDFADEVHAIAYKLENAEQNSKFNEKGEIRGMLTAIKNSGAEVSPALLHVATKHPDAGVRRRARDIVFSIIQQHTGGTY
jgi:hypothetical protein